MTWDPQTDGAQCSSCILSKLRAGLPVPSEFHEEAIGTCLAEAPGETEVERGRPLVGKSGLELEAALKSIGYARPAFNYVNVLACRPPDNKLSLVHDKLRRFNKKRISAGLEPLPTPEQCCRPRLERDLNEYAGSAGRNVIALGNVAYGAMTGKRTPILTVRGAPEGFLPEYELGHRRRVLPTMHPAFVARMRRWAFVFRIDLARAIRWFNSGKVDWKPPRVMIRPQVSSVAKFLSEYKRYTHDVETSISGGPLYNKLRCIGISTLLDDDEVLAQVVPLLSIDGELRYYDSLEENALRLRFADFFDQPNVEKEAHNRYFDELVEANWINKGFKDPVIAHRFFKTTAARQFRGSRCTLVMHKAVVAELPHKLAVVGSIHTEIPNAWKEAHTATDPTSDDALWKYNTIDLAIQARIGPPLREQVTARQQDQVVARDYKVQDICKGLHTVGMPVNEKRRAVKEVELRKEVEQLEWRVVNAARKAGQSSCVLKNPRSSNQLREQLFEAWKLAPATDARGKPIRTKSGAPSASYPALLSLRRRGDLSVQQVGFIDEMRKLKKSHKKLSAFIVPLSATGEGLEDDADDNFEIFDSVTGGLITPDVDELEFLELTDKQLRREGRVIDGRVHASWNVLPKTGRLSCSRPGLQTFPHDLRELFLAPKGFVWAYCDLSQVELRMAVARSGAQRYLREFKNPKSDPHSLAGVMIFGEQFARLRKEIETEAAERKKIRDFVKRFVYACVDAKTKVATLDARGWKYIKNVGPGDWTYAWNGTQYEPTRIVTSKCVGVRPVYKVTCQGDGGRREFKEIIATADHQFVMRDGTLKRLDELKAKDRLMPFRRVETVNVYRTLDTHNDGRSVYEHKHIKPGYKYVHHKDTNPANNTPDNLEGHNTAASHGERHRGRKHKLTAEQRAAMVERSKKMWAENYEELNAKLTEGRRRSKKWHAAQADPAVTAKKIGSRHENENWNLDPEATRKAHSKGARRAYERKQKEKNHKVVSVEFVGEREVWDLTVDHPAHNFAIYNAVFVHNCLYMAEAPTVHRVVTSVEGSCQAPTKVAGTTKTINCGRCNPCRHGGLLYADLSLLQTVKLRKNWLDENPEIEGWWAERLDSYRRNGYALDPWWGRRCDFLDGEESRVVGGDVHEVQNEVVNWDIQPGCAGMAHECTWRLLSKIRYEEWGPGTGLAFQGHDALGVLAPEKEVVEVARLLTECMTIRDDPRAPGMDFISEAAIGYDLHNLMAVGPCEKPNGAKKCCWIHFREAGGGWAE